MMHLCNFLKKIKIHPLTYFYFIISFITGYWKYYCSAYIIVCIHELCHYLMAYSFHFEIEKIELLPFGAYLFLNDYGLKPKINELCVVLAGLSCHFFIYMILRRITSILFVDYLLKINELVFVFNLLPIYPMDGYRLLLILLQNSFDMQKACYASFKISIFFLCFLYVRCRYLNNYIIFLYLVYQNFLYYRYIPTQIRNYYLNIPFSYKNKKIKIHEKIKYIRDAHNYYKINNEIYDEEMMKNELIKSIKRVN